MTTINHGSPDLSEIDDVHHRGLCVSSVCPRCGEHAINETDHTFSADDGEAVTVAFICAQCDTDWEEPRILRIKSWLE